LRIGIKEFFMRLQHIFLLLIVFLGFYEVVSAETLTCKSAEKFAEGGSQEHELSLVQTGGKITELLYSNVFSDGQEGGAYSCELSLVDGSANSKWVRVGTKIRVMDKEAEEQSFAEIEILPDGDYKVSFDRVSHSHCGFGAEFPDSVLLKKTGGKCVVEMP
jgi:hypothetical protein